MPHLFHAVFRRSLGPGFMRAAFWAVLAACANLAHAQEPDLNKPRPRPPLPSFFIPTDWDYPFVLEGFDKDVLTCASISPHLEGNKLCCAAKGEGASRIRRPRPAEKPLSFRLPAIWRPVTARRKTRPVRFAFRLLRPRCGCPTSCGLTLMSVPQGWARRPRPFSTLFRLFARPIGKTGNGARCWW